MVQDEDLALEMLKRDTGKRLEPSRRMSEWTPEAELLSIAVDRLSELIQATAVGHGAKPSPIKPAPRPDNAMDRVRSQERIRKHHMVVARVLPHKALEAGP